MEKTEIRKKVRQARDQLTKAKRQEKSDVICEKLINSEAFKQAKCIYTYRDFGSEVCVRTLIDACFEQNKRIAVPKVFGKELRFFYISSYADLTCGYAGIPEPIGGLPKANETDALVIVPGIAFDRQRNRCGYGGGFYDRYLAVHKKHQTIALAFELQMVKCVPTDAFDISVQRIITEMKIYQ